MNGVTRLAATHWDYLREATLDWMGHGGGIVIVLPVIVAICGIIAGDMRWLMVAAVVAFMLVPLVMAWVYYSAMLNPSASQNLIPHRAKVTWGEGIYLHFMPRGKLFRPEDCYIFWRMVTDIKRRKRYTAFYLKGIPKTMLIVYH